MNQANTQSHAEPATGPPQPPAREGLYHGPHQSLTGVAPQPQGEPASGLLPAEPIAPGNATHYPMIDVLRGFAALSVIVYHVIGHTRWQNFPVKGLIGDWFLVGWLSVDLFFVISGFVITLSAVKAYPKSSSPRSFRRGFMRRRCARIMPLHYLTCGVFLLAVAPNLLKLPRLGFHLWSHGLFVHNWHPATIGSINGVNWSLGVEMQFYLIVMAATPWLVRTHPLRMLLTCIGLSWLWRAGAYALFHDQIKFANNLTWMYTSQVFGMLDLFAWGALLAVLIARDTSGQLRARLRHWWLWLGLAALVAMPVMKIYWRNADYWTIPPMVILWRTPMGLVWACLVAAMCGLGNGRASRLAAPARYFGTISYGLYLWHLIVIELLKSRTSLAQTPELFLACTLVFSTILAAASWHFFEKPLLKRFSK